MQFPLDLRFKIIALASQIYVTDSAGNPVFYVKQKMFKLKENIEIYKDESKSKLLFNIKADRVLDFSPLFRLTDASGQEVGTIKRNGRRSIWKADYEIQIAGQPFAHVREANAWVKVGDALFGDIPLVGLLSGYVFQPKYNVEDPGQQQLAVLEKLPAFFEGKYKIESEALSQADQKTQTACAALLMTVALLERTRG